MLFAQTENKNTAAAERALIIQDSISSPQTYNPLAPSKAAFYSAVLPGLGQVYNEKYWKVPVIYAGMATGIYFYLENNKDYNRFRDAYKRRLAGYTDDEFQGISTNRLIDAQKSAQKNKDVSIIVAALFYLVNVVDANVDAHLQQFNVSEDLSLKPNIIINDQMNNTNYGLSLSYTIR